MNRICVYCGSKPGADESFLAAATQLGKAMTQRNHDLVYGGACIGLMGRIADSVLHGGGNAIGVIPGDLFNDEVTHRNLSELITVDNMHQRKEKMASLADGFVALPGGFGTFEELFEAITWSQLRIHTKPIGLLNVNGYYDSLHKFISEAVQHEFIKPKHQALYVIHDDPEKLLDLMEEMCF